MNAVVRPHDPELDPPVPDNFAEAIADPTLLVGFAVAFAINDDAKPRIRYLDADGTRQEAWAEGVIPS